MEYGFTNEGNQLLDEARIKESQRVQEALRLQEEAEIEAKSASYTQPIIESGQQPINYGFTQDGYDALEDSPDIQAPTPSQISKSDSDLSLSPEIENEFAPDIPQQQISPPEPELESEVQHRVTAYKTIQNVHDNEPGLAGELTAGLTYDPVEVKFNVEKTSQPAKNYDRFSAPEPEPSFEERLNNDAKEYQRQQDASFGEDMQSSPLYRNSSFNRYG